MIRPAFGAWITMIVLNERCLYRHLKCFSDYYHRSRTPLALEKDSPEPRPIQPPDAGRIVAIQQVGGLHHRYDVALPEQPASMLHLLR